MRRNIKVVRSRLRRGKLRYTRRSFYSKRGQRRTIYSPYRMKFPYVRNRSIPVRARRRLNMG